MNTNNDIIGNDELSRPVTHAMLDKADSSLAKLKIISTIEGPLQRHIKDIVYSYENTLNRLTTQSKRLDSFSDSVMDIIRHDVSSMIDSEFDSRSDTYPSEDRVIELVDEQMETRSFERKLESTISDAIDNHDWDTVKSDIQSEIERDLDTTISDAVEEKLGDNADQIIDQLVDKIESDPYHPLVNALLSAVSVRLSNISSK